MAKPARSGTLRKELEHLRAFYAFLVDLGYVESNYAKKVKMPKESRRPTMPFAQAEVERLLTAAAQLEDDNLYVREKTRTRARAILLTMLYTGLAIEDVATLRRDRMNFRTRQLFLRRAKTDEPVYVRVQPVAFDALLEMPAGGEYFFWSGLGDTITALKKMRRTVYRICKKAGVAGHPHRFRDTFAVRMLEHGVTLDQVSTLLGHSSIRTTQKYYAPWVRTRQRLLDEAVATLDFVSPLEDDTIYDTNDSEGRKLLKIKGKFGGSQWESNPPATQSTAQRV